MAHRTLAALTTGAIAFTIVVGQDGTGHLGPAFILTAYALFAALLFAEFRHPRLSAADVMVASVLVVVVAVAVPPQSSRDLWAYAMYGRAISQHHESPYTHTPAEHRDDPIFPRVNRAFRQTPSLYGPAFVAVAAAGTAAAGDSPLRIRLFFQGLAAAVLLATLALLHRSGAPPGALAIVGLNPLSTAAIVNNGHNDLLVGLGVLAAVLLVRNGRARWAGVAVGLACLVKFVALMPLGAIAIWLWRHDRRAAVQLVAVGGAIMALGYLLAGGMSALAPLHNASSLVSEMSVWDTVHDAERATPTLPSLGIWVPVGLIVGVVAAGWRRRMDPVAVTVAAVFAYLLVAPYVLPWYVGWILPTMALTWRSRLTRLALVHSSLLLTAYSLRPWMAPALRDAVDTSRNVLPFFEIAVVIALVVAAWRRRQATEELLPK